MELYPDQERFVEDLRDAFRVHQSVIAQAATGFGKTVVAAYIAKAAAAKGKRVYFTVHRKNLIQQTQRTFFDWDISHGVIASGRTPAPHESVQVASIQTLVRRLGKVPRCDLMVVDECFRGDVEILTERGFVRFDELREGVEVAQFRDGVIDFVLPGRIVSRPHDGALVHLHSEQTCDLWMTPNHELLLARKSGRVVKAPVGEAVLNAYNDLFVAAPSSAGGDPDLTTGERLLIAYQADGSEHRVACEHILMSFSFTKKRKIKRLHEIADEGGFSIHEVADDRSSRRRFMVRGPRHATKDLWDHFDISNLSRQKAAAIVEEMVLWDGHTDARGARAAYFSSVDPRQTDFYQAVAILAGYKTNKTVQVDDRSPTFRDVHRLFIVKDKDRINAQSLRRTTEHFSGTVYCVTVPSGNIVVRGGGRPLVVGNCHLACSDSWSKVLNHFRRAGARLLGNTATPDRLDSRPLGQHFDTIVEGPSVRELIDAGRLSDYKIYAPQHGPDLDTVRTRMGDYAKGELEVVMDQSTITGDAVDHYRRLMPGRRALAFCVSIKHSKHVAAAFSAAGVPAAHIDGTTSDAERQRVIRDFADGRVKVLSNVELVTTGFDLSSQVGREVPVEGAIMLRPTQSLVLWLQMLGRVMRRKPYPAIIADHAGGTHRHGLPDDSREWSLAGRKLTKKKAEELAAPDLRHCQECFAIFRTSQVCPCCGHQFEIRGAMPEHEDGELQEVDPEEHRRRRRVQRRREEAGADTLEEWVAIALERGYKSGWAGIRYAIRNGHKPGTPDSRRAVTEARKIAKEMKAAVA